MNCCGKKRGFTFVELLTVIAIIGILLAILIPALQFVRETARKTECSNKQMTIAQALQAYNSSKEHFPRLAYGSFDPVNGFVTQPTWSWSVVTLPYIEGQSLFDILNPGDGTTGNSAAFVFDPANLSNFQEALSTSLPIFRCASDSGPNSNIDRTFDVVGNPIEVATSNYVGSNSSGTFLDNTNGGSAVGYGCTYGTTSSTNNATVDGKGLFGSMRKPAKISDVTDGQANSLAIGERAWEYGPRNNRQYSRAAILYVGRPFNAFGYQPRLGAGDMGGTSGIGLNPRFGNGGSYDSADSYSSNHPGGANFAFVDGSVRFIGTDIDLATFSRLANIKDQLPLRQY
jgi:prepilin-type N-terminal cleavage/methylation domain-containing protein/prepilin-type processing-associated H-X9-DG protein